MRIRAVTWLGVPTDRFAPMLAFVRDDLGLEVRRQDDDFAALAAENGDVFELFGPAAIANGHEFMVAPVAGFEVDDVGQARAEMEAKGALFIGPVHRGAAGEWAHFYGPDGHVYELTADAASPGGR